MSTTRQPSEITASQPSQASYEALNRQIEILRDRVAHRDADNNRLEEENSSLRRSNMELQKQQDESFDEAEQLRRQVQDLQAQLTTAEMLQQPNWSFSNTASDLSAAVNSMQERIEATSSVIEAVRSAVEGAVPATVQNTPKDDIGLLSRHVSEVKTLEERTWDEGDYQGGEDDGYQKYKDDGDYYGDENDEDQGQEEENNPGDLDQGGPSPHSEHRPINVGEQDPHKERGDSVMGGTEGGDMDTNVDSSAPRHVIQGSYDLNAELPGPSVDQQGSAMSQAFMNVPSSLSIAHPPQKRPRPIDFDSHNRDWLGINVPVKFGSSQTRRNPWRRQD
ncbi:MAG: hypothetical protein Q9160_008937 [Pyrenula sp. 1 TL-2023]